MSATDNRANDGASKGNGDANQDALVFATIEEMVNELGRRSRGLIVSIAPNAQPGISTSMYSVGDRLVCQGLLMDLNEYLQKRQQAADPTAENEDES